MECATYIDVGGSKPRTQVVRSSKSIRFTTTDGPFKRVATATKIAHALKAGGFEMSRKKNGEQTDDIARWSKTIEKWHRDARAERAVFQSDYRKMCLVLRVSRPFNLDNLLTELHELCRTYRTPD
jgi:hypothetical protein